jgi:hypothetical protein
MNTAGAGAAEDAAAKEEALKCLLRTSSFWLNVDLMKRIGSGFKCFVSLNGSWGKNHQEKELAKNFFGSI